jgi:hypothetical protein
MEDEDEGEDIFAEDIYEFICKAESGWQERWKIIYLLLVGPQVQPWREFKELVEHIQRLEFPR